MDLFQAMRVFVKVAESHSFSVAARALDMSNASVTRHVADLEAHLNARLFNRSTRRLSLTEVGANYLERSRQLLSDLEDAALIASRSTITPIGTLRVNASIAFATNCLAPLLPAFAAAYSQVKLDFTLSDRQVDVVEEGFDVVIRIAQVQENSALFARKIADVPLLLVASPAYLAVYGTPEVPQDLHSHQGLIYTYAQMRDEWQLEHGGKQQRIKVPSRLVANNGDFLSAVAVAGLGLTLQPAFIVAPALREGKLVRVLPEYNWPVLPIYAVFASRQHMSAKVRTFIDFLAEQFGQADVLQQTGLVAL